MNILFLSYLIVIIIILYYVKDSFNYGYVLNNITFDYNDVLENPFFSFFADEKTEDATPKKIKDARKKGQVSKSNEVNSVVALVIGTAILLMFGSKIIDGFAELLNYIVKEIPNTELDVRTIMNILQTAIFSIMKIVSYILLPILLAGVAINLAQVGFNYSTEPLKMDFKKLNPVEGFKKIFSKNAAFELIKNLIKLVVIATIVYFFFLGRAIEFYNLSSLELNQVMEFIKKIFNDIMFQIILVSVVISIADFYFQRYTYKKQLKMSKQEIKEEFKESEGDPLIKSLRRQRQRQLVFSRMISEVPNATVIVTNPTHYAVAIKYDAEGDDVPIVVAKGMNYIAQKIKEIGKEHNIPIIENKPLARTLYKKVEVFDRIPIELYQAVAELLAMIYKINNKNR